LHSISDIYMFVILSPFKSFASYSCDFRTHHMCGLLWSGETHFASPPLFL
jgi:hypothetical protein